MKEDTKQHKQANKESEKETGNDKEIPQGGNPGTEQPDNKNPHRSAIYRKDPETGKWIVKNPAGSMIYNYLYGDEWEY